MSSPKKLLILGLIDTAPYRLKRAEDLSQVLIVLLNMVTRPSKFTLSETTDLLSFLQFSLLYQTPHYTLHIV